MPRAKLQREPCDCLDCREPAYRQQTGGGTTAAARLDPPPQSLVLCLTGVAPSEAASLQGALPHLDALVQGGCAGLLACRADGPALPLQLLGVHQAGQAPLQGQLPDRFKQLRAVLLTDSIEVAKAGEVSGCYAVQQVGSNSSASLSWPSTAELAGHIARLLHMLPPTLLVAAEETDKERGDDVMDILILVLTTASLAPPGGSSTDCDAINADGNSKSSGSDCSNWALTWVDNLLRHLNQVPGFRDTVLISLVLALGAQPAFQVLQEQSSTVTSAEHRRSPNQQQPRRQILVQKQVLVAAAGAAAADFPPVRRPLQSYQQAGLQQVAVKALCPALVVHRLPGVIRVDQAQFLSLEHFVECGAGGCILAEHLLPEVAYKLGRAAKYGA